MTISTTGKPLITIPISSEDTSISTSTITESTPMIVTPEKAEDNVDNEAS